MRGILLMFTLHLGDEHPSGDRWFAPDKAKHFFMAAFVQSASFGGLRAVGAGRSGSLAGAPAVTAGVSSGKEIFDARSGGTASAKDLTWDLAGMIAASAAVGRTEP